MIKTRLLRTVLIGTAGLLAATSAAGQVEEVVADEEGSAVVLSRVEELDELARDPIRLNHARARNLERLPWISPVLARRIVARRRIKPYRTVDDLATVPGVTRELVELIRPYVSVSPVRAGRDGRLFFGTTRGARSGVQFFTRYRRAFPAGVAVGVAVEKDVEEPSWADFTTVNLEVSAPAGSFARVVVGDFGMSCAQGLLLWTDGRRFVGDAAVRQIKARGRGLKPYASRFENGSLRGIALEKVSRGIDLSFFGSVSRLDARIDSEGRISSLDDSGRHVSDSERRNKDRLRESMIGAHALLFPEATLGVEAALLGAVYRPAFSGQTNVGMIGSRVEAGSIGFDRSKGSGDTFGEVAISRTGRGLGTGVTLGGALRFGKRKLALLYRRYSSGFYALRGDPFHSGRERGEHGIYLGGELRLRGGVRIRSYVDVSRQEKLSRNDYLFGNQYVIMSRFEKRLGRGSTASLRFKTRSKSLPEAPDDKRRSGRAELRWKVSRFLQTRLRAEAVQRSVSGKKDSNGRLVFIELKRKRRSGTSGVIRAAFFETQGYGSAVYEYEDDLPGRVTIQPLWDRGIRIYVWGRAVRGGIGVSAKIANTFGTHESREVSVQLDFRG